jgi:peptidoglycan/xylan/chitin deacetylase (PgdA/CDA1 family)
VRVQPRNFAEQMAVLREYAQPMSLQDFHAALDARAVPPRTVVVTFDDGYVDNLLAAKAEMIRHRVPGTVFVASGYVGSSREYWWDELDRLLLSPGKLPQRFTIAVGNDTFDADLQGDARLSLLKAWRARRWRGWQEDCPSRRHHVYRDFWAVLRKATTADREAAIESMRMKFNRVQAGRPTHRCVTLPQLKELAAGGLIEIGAHTATHPSLGAISVEDQRREINESKAALEEMLQQSMTSFAYPFGTRDDYSQATIDLLRRAGFSRACSNFPEAISSHTDRFQLPRRVVQDWNGREFIVWLEKWFADRGAVAGYHKAGAGE